MLFGLFYPFYSHFYILPHFLLYLNCNNFILSPHLSLKPGQTHNSSLQCYLNSDVCKHSNSNIADISCKNHAKAKNSISATTYCWILKISNLWLKSLMNLWLPVGSYNRLMHKFPTRRKFDMLSLKLLNITSEKFFLMYGGMQKSYSITSC